MEYWQTIVLVLVGTAIVLVPIVVLAASTSRLVPRERNAFLILYGAGVLLIMVAAADLAEWLPSRAVVNVVLLGGGFALGAFVATTVASFRNRTRGQS